MKIHLQRRIIYNVYLNGTYYYFIEPVTDIKNTLYQFVSL